MLRRRERRRCPRSTRPRTGTSGWRSMTDGSRAVLMWPTRKESSADYFRGFPPAPSGSSVLSRSSLDGVACAHPRVESTVESVHVRESPGLQFARHTGAGVLVRSGAVRHDGTAARDLVHVRGRVVRRYPDRTWNLGIGLAPGFGAARIYEHDRFPPVEAAAYFIDGDSRNFHGQLLTFAPIDGPDPCRRSGAIPSSLARTRVASMPAGCGRRG
jgi:hypothetical protein